MVIYFVKEKYRVKYLFLSLKIESRDRKVEDYRSFFKL